MKIRDGKIICATELELYDYWLKRNYDDIYSFSEYIQRCQEAGVRVCKKEKTEISSVEKRG